MFSDKGLKFSNFEILILITAFEKKSLSFIATSSSFVIRVLYSPVSFILSEDCSLFDKKGLSVFQKHLFSVMCFSFKLSKYFFRILQQCYTLFSVFSKSLSIFTTSVLLKRLISEPCPCHDCIRDFRVNERFLICSKISFLPGKCFSSTSVQILEKASKPFS